MAPVTVIDTIAPKNNGNFSVAEDVYLKGGWRVAADLTARDAIPALRRKEGMRCYVITTGKQYYLDGGIDNADWVEVADGGGSTPMQILDALRTQESLVFEVDYATGTSPDLDTLVHTQDEVDALGILKYCQDVLNVLPPFRDYDVEVSVAAGDQYAPSDNYNSFLAPYPIVRSPKSSVMNTGTQPIIAFTGQANVLETGIAGTSSNDAANRRYKFVRSSGVWVAGELVNKILYITSGAGSGNFAVIYDNSTTEAYYVFNPPTGACAVEIWESATNLLPDTDGAEPVYMGVINYSNDGTASPIIISMCNVGSSAFHWPADVLGRGSVEYEMCNFTGWPAIIGEGDPACTFRMMNCSINTNTADFGAIYVVNRGPRVALIDVIFIGNLTPGSKGFIYGATGALFSDVESVRIIPDASYTGACIRFEYDVQFHGFGDYLDVYSTDLACTGLLITDCPCGVFKGANRMGLNGCAIVVSIVRSQIAFNTAFPATIVNNTLGWNLQAATVRAFNPSTVAATTAVSMYATGTPETFAYTALAAIGDQVISSVGESLHRIG
jgi:hypothetical protein